MNILPLYMCAHVCSWWLRRSGECLDPWIWSYGQLWATIGLLGIEPGSSKRATSIINLPEEPFLQPAECIWRDLTDEEIQCGKVFFCHWVKRLLWICPVTNILHDSVLPTSSWRLRTPKVYFWLTFARVVGLGSKQLHMLSVHVSSPDSVCWWDFGR